VPSLDAADTLDRPVLEALEMDLKDIGGVVAAYEDVHDVSNKLGARRRHMDVARTIDNAGDADGIVIGRVSVLVRGPLGELGPGNGGHAVDSPRRTLLLCGHANTLVESC